MGEHGFNSNEGAGRLFDQDAVDEQEANLLKLGASDAGTKDDLDFVPPDLAELAAERAQMSLEEIEKIWAMEDLQAQAKVALEKARARRVNPERVKLALKMLDASNKVEGLGFGVGLAARMISNGTLAQAGAYAMSSAWVVREAALRLYDHK